MVPAIIPGNKSYPCQYVPDQVPYIETLIPTGTHGVTQACDTFYYGGTVWDASDLRWEAASPDFAGWSSRKMWTWSPTGFNGTPHSGENMDGWKGGEVALQLEDYFNVKDNATLCTACVISGSKSLFCGATPQECTDLCFKNQDGTGYGNGWVQRIATPTYTYSEGDFISLAYTYRCETQPDEDQASIVLQVYDTVGPEWVDVDTLVTYSGSSSGTEGIDVGAALAGLSGPLDFRFLFTFVSGRTWSDEDGLWATTCGALAVDDYALNKNGSETSEDFEAVPVGDLPAGWYRVLGGCGDYARAELLSNLPINLNSDPCVAAVPGSCEMEDSVLVLFDTEVPAYPHPLCQNNYVLSPVIDLDDNPEQTGRTLSCEILSALPPTDNVFAYWQIRYKPGCASGSWSPWVSDENLYYFQEYARCYRWTFDVSSLIPPEAEEVQFRLGVANYCDEDRWGSGCTYGCNVTPYFDNVTFGVFSPPGASRIALASAAAVAPTISVRGYDCYQDQFPEDGTLNPTSTADSRIAELGCGKIPPMHADTVVVQSASSNMEVWLGFRMARVGPKQAFAAPFFTWFPNVQLGGWFEARMDTAEVTNSVGTGTNVVPGKYMSCFHEADPVGSGLAEGTEILPNNIFVPGTRIEYFFKACYTGSADTFYLPADGPGAPQEFDILPMMVDDGAGSVEWPCLIYVDHFGQRGNGGLSNSDRTAAALTAAGYQFDTFHKLAPTSDLKDGIGRWAPNPGQLGGPGTPKYTWGPGATIYQMLAYSHCILNCGSVYGYSIYRADADLLREWLTVYTDADHSRFLWVSGDSWARELNQRAPWGPLFLNSTLATAYASRSYSATANDYTYCLQVNSTAGGAIVSPIEPYYIRQNGCPRTFNCISATGTGVLEERYDATTPSRYAAVSNAPGGMFYRTFTEGYDWCVMRDGAAGYPTCGVDPLAGWFSSVLTWAGLSTSALCTPSSVIGVEKPGAAPPAVTWLGEAFPNPMNPTATIKFTIGAVGKVQLRVFDVSGRVIKTLVDETRAAGTYSVVWDGTNDRGETVASGVFFYQLNAPGYSGEKKIVILR